MKFLLDANVEFRLATFLTSLGHDVKTIAHDFPAFLTDHEVLTLAVKQQRILITNDRDYGALIFRQHLTHCGIIYFRLKNSQHISEKLHWLKTVLTLHKNNLDAYIVIAPNGIRVRKPETEEQAA